MERWREISYDFQCLWIPPETEQGRTFEPQVCDRLDFEQYHKEQEISKGVQLFYLQLPNLAWSRRKRIGVKEEEQEEKEEKKMSYRPGIVEHVF